MISLSSGSNAAVKWTKYLTIRRPCIVSVYSGLSALSVLKWNGFSEIEAKEETGRINRRIWIQKNAADSSKQVRRSSQLQGSTAVLHTPREQRLEGRLDGISSKPVTQKNTSMRTGFVILGSEKRIPRFYRVLKAILQWWETWVQMTVRKKYWWQPHTYYLWNIWRRNLNGWQQPMDALQGRCAHWKYCTSCAGTSN